MAYIRKDVNGLLLFLVLLTCTALVGLTVVFAQQFEAMHEERDNYNLEIQSKLTEITEKSQKVNALEQNLQEKQKIEQELKSLIIKKR